MDIRLPNGVVLRNIPEDATPEEIQAYAIQTGKAKASDFAESAAAPNAPSGPSSTMQRIGASLVDILPEIGGLGGAGAGAALGAPLGPFGALAGGAIGAFSGAGAGESARQLIEGEPADPLRALGTAATEGVLDITGAKAVDVLGDVGKFIGRKFAGPKKLDDPERLADLQELQRALRERGTTLRMTQANPDSAFVEGLESAAENAIGGKKAFEAIADAQKAYADEQIEALLKSQSNLNVIETGNALQQLIENTRQASAEAFQQVFNELDAVGRQVPINMQGIRNLAVTGRAKATQGLTRQAREAAGRGRRIPFLDPKIDAVYKDLLDLSPTGNFASYFDKLKRLKQQLTALRGDPATRNNPAVAELTNIVKQFETKMVEQARKANPELASQYESAMKAYSKSQDTLYADTVTEALKKNPEAVASLIVSKGSVTPLSEIENLVKEAKKLGVQTNADVIGGLRRSFLEQALSAPKGQGVIALRQMDKLLADPAFARTYEALFDKSLKDNVEKAIRQAEILSRGPGGELALSIRSRQATAAESVIRANRSALDRLSAAFTVLTPRALAKLVTQPERVDRLLKLTTAANAAVSQGKEIPPAVYRGLVTLLADAGVQVEQNVQERRGEQTRQEVLPELERLQRMLGQ